MLQQLSNHLNGRTLKPLIFSVSGYTFSDVANIFIFMNLYDLCLLPALFRYVITNISYLESHVQLAFWKFTSGAKDFVLQALQF
jgi:hypothetical protein